jgi:hypothetical protein
MGSPDPSGTRAAAHRHDGVDRVQAATFPSRSEMLPQVSKSLSLTTHRQERGEQTTQRRHHVWWRLHATSQLHRWRVQQVDDTWGSRFVRPLSLNGKLEISTSRLERPWNKSMFAALCILTTPRDLPERRAPNQTGVSFNSTRLTRSLVSHHRSAHAPRHDLSQRKTDLPQSHPSNQTKQRVEDGAGTDIRLQTPMARVAGTS